MSEWSLPDPASRVRALPEPDAGATTRIVPTATVGGAQSGSAWLLVVGGGLAVLGSILPWSVVTSFQRTLSADGLSGDGRATLVLGVVIAAVGVAAFVAPLKRTVGIVALVAAVVVLVVAGYNAFDLDALGTAGDQMASLEVGHGLLITAIGGAVGVVGGVRLVAVSEDRQRA